MSQTTNGAIKARDKILARDPDHYRKVGRLGGLKTGFKGFAANPELARRAGAIGGRISRKRKKEA